MKISHSFLVVCAAATVSLVQYGRAADTPNQAKARESERMEMDRLNGTAQARPAGPAAFIPLPPASAGAAALPHDQTGTPFGAVPSASNPTTPTSHSGPGLGFAPLPAPSAAVAPGDSFGTVPPPSSVHATLPPAGAIPMAKAPAVKPVAAPVPAKPAPAPKEQAQANPSTKKPEATTAGTTKPEPAAKPAPTKTAMAFKPIEAPPLPLSAEKQQLLTDLLKKYRADEITPEQYHEQRAKILAQP